MSKYKKLIFDLKAVIISIDMELSLLEQELDAINTNIEYFETLQSVLIENIDFLRRDKIIATLGQYKESITQLKEISAKMKLLSNQRVETEKQLNEKIKEYTYFFEQLENNYLQAEDNVIDFPLGAKDE